MGRLHLEVFGCIGIDDGETGLDVVDEDDPRLRTGESGENSFVVLGGRDTCREFGLDTLEELR